MIFLSEVLKLTRGACTSNEISINSSKINSLKVLHEANSDDITFFNGSFRYKYDVKQTKAKFCFIAQKNADDLPPALIPIIVDNVQMAVAQTATLIYGNGEYKSSNLPNHIHETAKIHTSAVIDGNVIIEEGVTIMAHSFIGSGSIIRKNVFIYDSCSILFSEIGENSVILSGSRIGSAGFGFAPNTETGEHYKIPQVGRVILGKNVDIGSNTTVDRGFLGNTTIGDYTKIDNLVQIGHGAKIGKSCFIAAHAGISGSATIGDFCSIGGQVGINGHIMIGDGSVIAAQSGVISDLPPLSKVAGTPSLPINTFFKIQAYIKKFATV